MNTLENLNKLAELDAQRNITEMEKEKLVQSVLTPEIKQHLRDIDDEFAPQLEAINNERSQIEAEVRNDVMVSGESVKGDFYRASYVQGRTLWDTKALDGYAAAHPEIVQFKKEGAPSVRISKV
jgi:hypothetical protein